MFRFLALLAFSVSWEYSKAHTVNLSSDESVTLSSDESVTCSDRFFLKPQDTDRETFLDQFKPCGWYLTHCQDKFGDWFRNHGGFTKTDYNFIEPNVCYPGDGQNDLFNGIHLVQFDIGLDETHYEASLELKNEPGKRTLIDDISGAEPRKYLTFPKNQAGEYFQSRTMKFGETCIETFAKTVDDWGVQYGGDYGCMGKCGPGCFPPLVSRRGKDCMKHDVCSFFKAYALRENADGFCQDFDCGDEAAQAVVNCRKNSWFSEPVVCSKDSYWVDISKAARAQSQKRACILRSKWDRNQGMPWLRREDDKPCDTFDDCQSRRCDYNWRARRVCMQRKDNNQPCNEDSDCKSTQCRRDRWRWRCKGR